MLNRLNQIFNSKIKCNILITSKIIFKKNTQKPFFCLKRRDF